MNQPPVGIANSSLAELRRELFDHGRELDPSRLSALRQDPRAGARRLALRLERQEEARRREAARLEALLTRERALWEAGLKRIAGVDEAGAGPLAGPVVAGAVILPPGTAIERIDDSKRLDPKRRRRLEVEIRAQALATGIGLASPEEIDRIDIGQASRLAMRRALDAMPIPPERVLIDARRLEDLPWEQEAHIRGDATIHCIAAASILAKVYRDRLMIDYDRLYPGYGFARHKGYGTAAHREAIRRLGPSPIHRLSFHWGPGTLPLFTEGPPRSRTPA